MAAGAAAGVAASSGSPRVSSSSASDRGRVRSLNEDSVLAEHPVYVVADGMGGHERGEEASRRAVAALADLRGTAPGPSEVLEAITAANRSVIAIAHEDDEKRGGLAGTTLTGVVLVDAGLPPLPHWMAINIGYSRVYTWNGRDLQQVSTDHSAVQELVDAGAISPDEARQHPDRNVITKALGVVADLTPDVWLIPLRAGHGFVICSDGLSNELADVEIAEALVRFQPGERSIAEVLVDLALERGGHDNVSVIVLEVNGATAVHEVSATRDTPIVPEETAPRLNRGDA